jgi:hypothetical protein
MKGLIIMENNDWRIRWQEDYLKGRTFYFHEYNMWSEQWNHEHCEFCWKKIGKEEDTCHEGYSTLDDYYWICADCFKDFKEYFSFQMLDMNKQENENILDITAREIDKLNGSEDTYQLSRVINLLSKPLSISSDKISISILPARVKVSPKRSEKNSIILFNESKVSVLNESRSKLVEILTNINNCLNCEKDINDILYVQFKAL